MAKIIAWLVLIFLVLLALRVIALRNARGRRSAARGTASPSPAEATVRCVRCGVFVPRTEAKKVADGYVCASGGCLPHG